MCLKTGIQCLVFLWFLSNNCETKEFCEAFVENNNQIDYDFRQIKANDSAIYLFIDNHYWNIHFDNNFEDKQKSVVLYPTDSRQSKQWFGSQYSMAFCLWHSIENYCAFGLINKEKTVVDFRQRVGHSGTEHKLREYKKLNETGIDFYNFNPVLAFVPLREQYNKKLVVFVEQQFNSFFETKLYEFDDQFQASYVQNDSLRDKVMPKAIKQLDPDLDVIAISAQKGWKRRMGSDITVFEVDYGLIVFFKFSKVIKYCWTQDMQLNDNCKRENLKTLINCTKYENHFNKQTNPQLLEITLQKVSEKSGNLGLISSIIIVIIIVCVLGFILLYRRYKYNFIERPIDLNPIVNEFEGQVDDSRNKY